MSLMVYTLIKTLFNNRWWRKLYTQLIQLGVEPGECGNSVFLTNLILKIINEYDKIYIYSPSLHQVLYQKLIKCSRIYIPINIIPNILIEEDNDLLIDEIVKIKHFNESDIEIETYESIEELKFPQENVDGGIILLDDLNEKEMNDSEFNRCVRDQDIIIYLYFYIVKIITSYQRER